MSSIERVTVSLSSDVIEAIDRAEPNRSRFIAEAVTRELARRRRQQLSISLATPHADSVELAGMGLADWTADFAAEDGLLVDASDGEAVLWVEGRGWVRESA